MILYSWNVNGIRASLKKGFLEWFQQTKPDVLCLQETKAHAEQLPPELRVAEGYQIDYCAAQRRGYSGVSTWSREKPKRVDRGFGLDERFDTEGRILMSEYEDFVLLNIYFPNGNQNDERLQYKLDFYDATLQVCNGLRKAGKSVIVCGDVNTAHNEIDIARPKENEKVSGFLRIERDWMDKFVGEGYVDCFRRLYPDLADQYSWWSMRTGARSRNVGWRLDYFFVSEDFWPRVKDSKIHPEVTGSDHCPVSLEIT